MAILSKDAYCPHIDWDEGCAVQGSVLSRGCCPCWCVISRNYLYKHIAML